MSKQHDRPEGVAITVKDVPRYEAGVPVSVPKNASEQSESKPAAKSATSTKES